MGKIGRLDFLFKCQVLNTAAANGSANSVALCHLGTYTLSSVVHMFNITVGVVLPLGSTDGDFARL
uniref:Uncharacterized protein n=1 Tax=Arundo donax TaxID=35708 RepID=A0A0A9FP37_ARUDO